MLYLITGSKGYVGSYVKKIFIENNERIKELTFELSEDTNYHETYEEDFIVIHIAGEKSNDIKKLIKNNIVATCYVIKNLVLQEKCKGMVFISSIAVFGIQDEIITENSAFRYENYYGFSKYICEKMICESLVDKNYYILRPTNIYSDDNNNLIGMISDSIKKGKEFEIWKSSLTTKRNYIHVNEVSKIIYKAAQNIKHGTIQKSINVASDKSYSLEEIIKFLEKKYNNKLNQKIINNIGYRGRDLLVDNRLLIEEFGVLDFNSLD